MMKSFPSEGGDAEGTFPPSGDPPSIIEFLGGEPGLLEHILLFLVKENDTSAERVVAGTTAVRWLNVCKQTKQLVRSGLWVLLTATYYPNYPLPKLGYVYASTLFREMWYRHNEVAKAKAQVKRLNADFHRALIKMSGAWNTQHWGAAVRHKWEIGESRKAALSDMEWRASFLKTWDGALKTVPIHRQNGERFS